MSEEEMLTVPSYGEDEYYKKTDSHPVKEFFSRAKTFIKDYRTQLTPTFIFLGIWLLSGLLTAIFSPITVYNWHGIPISEAPPHTGHLLGTNVDGNDVFQTFVIGLFNSLNLGLMCGLVTAVIAIVIGTVAPYIGGFFDSSMQLLTNIILVFPTIPFQLLVASIYRNSYWLMILIICMFNWPWAARAVRSQVLSLKERNYIKVAQLSGVSKTKIALTEIVPNIASYAMLVFVIVIGSAILTEAGLAIIGLGQQDFLTLGMLMDETRQQSQVGRGMYWMWLPPGLILGFLLLLLFILNNEMAEIFNPRLRDK